jgi:protein-disulfide isomerase
MPSWMQRAEQASSVVLAVCAVVLMITYVWGSVGSNEGGGQAAGPPPVSIAEWRTAHAPATPFGDTTGAVQLVEFSDFQCPYCARFADTLAVIARKYEGRVTVAYRHMPIERRHPAAFEAAMASECAAAQGRFRAYHDALFATQETLGDRPWLQLAVRSAVPDTVRFLHCMRDSLPAHRVREDLNFARSHQLRGTPTTIINGRIVRGIATVRELEDLLAKAGVARAP